MTVIHGTPAAGGGGLTPCCRRTPFELPRTDQMTLNQESVTCIELNTHLLLSEDDLVNHPPHYTSHPSGVECIQITEHMGFNLGNAVKYIWRADEKGNALEDLEKARWYIDRELQRRAAQ